MKFIKFYCSNCGEMHQDYHDLSNSKGGTAKFRVICAKCRSSIMVTWNLKNKECSSFSYRKCGTYEN